MKQMILFITLGIPSKWLHSWNPSPLPSIRALTLNWTTKHDFADKVMLNQLPDFAAGCSTSVDASTTLVQYLCTLGVRLPNAPLYTCTATFLSWMPEWDWKQDPNHNRINLVTGMKGQIAHTNWSRSLILLFIFMILFDLFHFMYM